MNNNRNGFYVYLKNITTKPAPRGYVKVTYRKRTLGLFPKDSIKTGLLEVHVLGGEESSRNKGESLIDIPNNRNENQRGVPVKTKDLIWDD